MNPIDSANTREQALMQYAAQRRIPVNGSIEVSPLCNMDCDMCFVRLSRAEMEAQGRLRTAEEWLEIARQMKEAGVLFLLLTGGEPLLYPDFKPLYLGLKELGMIVTLNTNATLLDEEWADFFAANRPRRINVTLYGIDDRAYCNLCHNPGGFAQTMRAIDLLKERDVPFRLSCSVTRENAPDLEEFLNLSRSLELHCGIDTYMMPATRERSRPYRLVARLEPERAAHCAHEIARAHFADAAAFREHCRETLRAIDAAEQFFREHPELRKPVRSACLAGLCSFSISWQGKLHPCVMLTSPDADVFQTGFSAAWKRISDGMEQLLLNADCTVCPRRTLCDTCPAAALHETGAVQGKPEYLCRYAEERERLMREELPQTPKDLL